MTKNEKHDMDHEQGMRGKIISIMHASCMWRQVSTLQNYVYIVHPHTIPAVQYESTVYSEKGGTYVST